MGPSLAVATPARLPDLPDVPTMIESGFPDFIASSWTSIMAPTGTPKDIVGWFKSRATYAMQT